jgi:hypothetical protein
MTNQAVADLFGTVPKFPGNYFHPADGLGQDEKVRSVVKLEFF